MKMALSFLAICYLSFCMVGCKTSASKLKTDGLAPAAGAHECALPQAGEEMQYEEEAAPTGNAPAP